VHVGLPLPGSVGSTDAAFAVGASSARASIEATLNHPTLRMTVTRFAVTDRSIDGPLPERFTLGLM
jgi:hypothetical protein